MWQATIRCEGCSGTHVLTSGDGAAPRVYAYACPKSGERVEVRFRDPSRMIHDWEQVGERPAGAIRVDGTSSRGAFEA